LGALGGVDAHREVSSRHVRLENWSLRPTGLDETAACDQEGNRPTACATDSADHKQKSDVDKRAKDYEAL
jgi:hypothetical protein